MKHDNLMKMIITALMLGITVIMSWTPMGTIVLPIVSITIAFIPAIITTIMVGFWHGLAVATFAGILSLVRAYFIFTWLAPFLQNPMVSVLPRMMIVVVVFIVYKALSKTKLPKFAAVAITAAAGSITNTVGVLGMMWLLYAGPALEVAINQGHASVWAMILSIILSNALLEMVGNTILTTAVVMGLKRANQAIKT